MSERMKKYIDTTKLSKEKLEQLKQLLGDDIYVQRSRTKFKKSTSVSKEAINIIDRKGNIFVLPIDQMPKYLTKQTISKLIAG